MVRLKQISLPREGEGVGWEPRRFRLSRRAPEVPLAGEAVAGGARHASGENVPGDADS
jgi:hypothetical protein